MCVCAKRLLPDGKINKEELEALFETCVEYRLPTPEGRMSQCLGEKKGYMGQGLKGSVW